jgi:hypothetical protein
MTEHVMDDLPLLLTGQATREETRVAADHLRGCPDCQQELISALAAHASLTSAARFAPEVVAQPESLTADATPLPDLHDVLALAREEAGATRSNRRRRRVVAVAAAAVIATGVGVAAAELAGQSSHSSAGRTIALAAFEAGTRPAQATVDQGGTMKIDASALPRLDPRHFYEVWLTNRSRTKLQAIGSIGTTNRAVLTVSPNVMSEYSAIEVSVQRVDQTSYSGISVVRGSYG